MAQTDIVFRLIPVHPDDWELLGMLWNGFCYFDKVLPFGLRSAPNILTSSLMPLSGYFKTTLTVRYPFCHILDDYHIVDLLPPLCRVSLSGKSI